MPITLRAFLQEHPDAEVGFMPGLLYNEPELAVLALRTVALWAYIEHDLTVFVGDHLARTDFRVACELVMDQPWHRKADSIKRLARDLLGAKEAGAVDRVMAILSGPANNRHKFVHRLWGTVKGTSGWLVLVSGRVMTRALVSGDEMPPRGDWSPEMIPQRTVTIVRGTAAGEAFLDNAEVYSKQDLEDALGEAWLAISAVRSLSHGLGQASLLRLRLLEEQGPQSTESP